MSTKLHTLMSINVSAKTLYKDFISKLQTFGCDINPTSYSKLKGQHRIASDKEVSAAAKVLNVSIDELFE